MEDKLKILLCEDDENLGMLLREYLQAKDYTAVLCPDGEVGYKEFLKSKFDICVLDVMMPKKDGFTLAQEIRQANAEIPIIFLTAKTLKEDILEGFEITTKPVNDIKFIEPLGEEFYYRLQAIIQQHHGEFGEPCHTVEAYIVHLVDMFESRVQMLEESLPFSGSLSVEFGKYRLE